MDDVCVDCKEVGGTLCKRKLCAYHAALEDLKENIDNQSITQDIFFVQENIWNNIAYKESDYIASYSYNWEGSMSATPMPQGSQSPFEAAGIKPTQVGGKLSGSIVNWDGPVVSIDSYSFTPEQLTGGAITIGGEWTPMK